MPLLTTQTVFDSLVPFLSNNGVIATSSKYQLHGAISCEMRKKLALFAVVKTAEELDINVEKEPCECMKSKIPDFSQECD